MKSKLWLAILLFPMLAHAELTSKDIIGQWDCRVFLTDEGMAVDEKINLLADNTFQGVRHQTVPLDIELEDGKPFPIALNYRMETSGKWKLLADKLIIEDYVPQNVTAEHDEIIQKWLHTPPKGLTNVFTNTLKLADEMTNTRLSQSINTPMSFAISIKGNAMKLTSQVTEYCQRVK